MTEASPGIFLPKSFPLPQKAVEGKILSLAQPSGQWSPLPIPPGAPRVVVIRVVVIIVAWPAVPPAGIVIPSPSIMVVMVVRRPVPVPMVIGPSGTLPALRGTVPAMVSLIAACRHLCPHLFDGGSLGWIAKGAAHSGLSQGLGTAGPTKCQHRPGQEKNLEALG